MNLLGYARVSTRQQANDGTSIDAQIQTLQRRTAAAGDNLVRVWTDAGVSGKKAHRPGLESLKEQLESDPNLHGVIITKLDRIMRSLHDFTSLVVWLDERDKVLICLDPELNMATAAGKMFANIMAAAAQMESDMASERTKDIIEYRKSVGLPVGGRPTRDDFAMVAQCAWNMRHDGLTWREVADEMYKVGHRTTKGERISPIMCARYAKRWEETA